MAVYAPGDTPQDADPGMFARIQQYLAGLNPIGSANAAQTNPLTQPSPVDPRLAGGGPPVPSSLTGPPPAPVPINPGGGSSGGGGASASWFPNSSNMPLPWNGPPPDGGPAWFPHSNTPMPWNGPNAPLPPSRPSAVAGAGGGRATRIPATATASVPAGPSFGGIDRQNLSATGWNPGTRQGTALDLSRMFGMPSDVNPPVSGGALSKGGLAGRPDYRSIGDTPATLAATRKAIAAQRRQQFQG
jgi:hypothetical protein